MKPKIAAQADTRKGARTRARIVQEAATLFNMRGFAGTSVNDVSDATGLEKGGIYNHFRTKDDLAVAAFDYAATVIRERLVAAVSAHRTGAGQLKAMLEVYATLAERPFFLGGCPILNTSVDADDTHPTLREHARAAMSGWMSLVSGSLETGRADGEFRIDFDVEAVAGTLVAAMEGGILLSKLYSDARWMRGVADQLAAYIATLSAQTRPARNAPC